MMWKPMAQARPSKSELQHAMHATGNTGSTLNISERWQRLEGRPLPALASACLKEQCKASGPRAALARGKIQGRAQVRSSRAQRPPVIGNH